MANRNAPFGAAPVGRLGAAGFNGTFSSFLIPSTDNTALYVGDFVKHTATGGTTKFRQTLPIVTRAGVGDTLLGFIIGFAPDSDYLNQIYRTASTERIAYVCNDRDATFEIQTNGTALVTNFNSNADIVLGTPSTVFGTSGTQLDQATVTADSAQIRILGIIQTPDNEIGLYAKLLCKMNEYYLG